MFLYHSCMDFNAENKFTFPGSNVVWIIKFISNRKQAMGLWIRITAKRMYCHLSKYSNHLKVKWVSVISGAMLKGLFPNTKKLLHDQGQHFDLSFFPTVQKTTKNIFNDLSVKIIKHIHLIKHNNLVIMNPFRSKNIQKWYLTYKELQYLKL